MRLVLEGAIWVALALSVVLMVAFDEVELLDPLIENMLFGVEFELLRELFVSVLF